ncbi:MAG: cell wall surface anchor family protein [Bacteriophage sp.]|nr:MAG: cell wall surface anchor family protein [Bacteriophage sp.]
MAINPTYRLIKGSPLTWSELDGNFRQIADQAATKEELQNAIDSESQAIQELGERVDRAILSYPSYESASAAAFTLPNGQEIEINSDETRDGQRTRYIIQDHSLVFLEYAPDAIRMQSYDALRAYSGKSLAVDITQTRIAGRFNCLGIVSWATDNGGTLLIDTLGRLWERVYFGRASIEWFAPNEVGDNTSGFQMAIDAAIPLKLSSRITILGQLTLRENTSIQLEDDGELDCSAGTGTAPIIIANGSLSAGVTTSVANARWATTILAPNHGLSVGDWFRITSTVSANSPEAGYDQLGDRADFVPLCETHCVETITNANEFTIRGALLFNYVAGSKVQKISSVDGIRLTKMRILCGGRRVRPIQLTLCRNPIISDLECVDAAADVMFRGCFDAPGIYGPRIHGLPNQDTSYNAQFIKIVDGTVAAQIIEIDLANGGQMIDVTYTPGNELVAPTINTRIAGGVVRNAYLSAIVDHPTCWGTRVESIKMFGVKGAVYLRSRNGTADSIEAIGTQDPSNGIGVWAGENGFFRGLSVNNCRMVNFDRGYHYAGSQNPVGRTISHTTNYSENCRIGEYWGPVPVMSSTASISSGSRHVNPKETGIAIAGNWRGSIWRDFSIEGACSDSGINISAALTSAKIEGQVVDIGDGIPPIKVYGSSPSGLWVDVQRFGSCGVNSGLTRSMASSAERVGMLSAISQTVTGTTSETDISTPLISIPASTFDGNARLQVDVIGTVSGTAGTKTLRLKIGASTWGSVVTMSASETGAFNAKFFIEGIGISEQKAFAELYRAGANVVISGPTSRTVNLLNGSNSIRLTAQLSDANDSIIINRYESKAAWL